MNSATAFNHIVKTNVQPNGNLIATL